MQNAGFYKIKVDGTDKTKISDYGIITGGWSYYIKRNNNNSTTSLYRVKMDGTGEEQIPCSDEIGRMVVEGDYIYYSDSGSIIRMRTDGTDKTKLFEVSALTYSFNVSNGNTYCTVFDSNSKLPSIYKISSSGQVENILTKEGLLNDIWVADNQIYFYSSSYKEAYLNLYKMDTDGTDIQLVNRIKKYQ